MRTLNRLLIRYSPPGGFTSTTTDELYFLTPNAVARAREILGRLEALAVAKGNPRHSRTANELAAELKANDYVYAYNHAFTLHAAEVTSDKLAMDERKGENGIVLARNGIDNTSEATDAVSVPSPPLRPSSDVNFKAAADAVFGLMEDEQEARAELARIKKALGEARHKMHRAMSAKVQRGAKK